MCQSPIDDDDWVARVDEKTEDQIANHDTGHRTNKATIIGLAWSEKDEPKGALAERTGLGPEASVSCTNWEESLEPDDSS